MDTEVVAVLENVNPFTVRVLTTVDVTSLSWRLIPADSVRVTSVSIRNLAVMSVVPRNVGFTGVGLS